MLRLLPTVLTVAAVSVSACGGSSNRPSGETGGSGGTGGTAGEPGTAGTGGGGASASDAGMEAGVYDAPPIPSSVSIEMAPALVAGVICAKVYACCQPSEGIRPLTGSQAACDLFVSATLGALMSEARTAVSTGRATYDAAALAACLQKYTDQSCTEARATGGLSAYRSCKFVQPLVPVGGACRNHVECVGGYCVTATDAGDGACAAKKADGETCVLADECLGGRCTGQCAQSTPEGLCVVPGGA